MPDIKASSIQKGMHFTVQPFDDFKKIQEETLSWFLNQEDYKGWINHNDKFHRSGICEFPISKLDTLPITSRAVKQFGKPQRITYWITRGEDTLPCHVDGGWAHFYVPRCRLLFPIINYEGSTTIFYDKNAELEDFQDTKGVSYLRPVDPLKLKETERVEVDQPIWIRIDVPHTVINPNKNIRITFTVVYDHSIQLEHMPR